MCAGIYLLSSVLFGNQFFFRLTAKLGHCTTSSEETSYESNAVTPELHSTLVSIIDELTNSRDKIGPIKKLYFLIQSNPSLDVSQYLHRTSSVFRKYVLDTLKQMDEQKSKQDRIHSKLPVNAADIDDENRQSSGAGDLGDSTIDAKGVNEGFEAMRIIEGLKKQQSSKSNDSPR